MLTQIRIPSGGRAAEFIYYGKGIGLTTSEIRCGARHPMARQMICRYGMDDDFGLLCLPEMFSNMLRPLHSPIYQRVSESCGAGV